MAHQIGNTFGREAVASEAAAGHPFHPGGPQTEHAGLEALRGPPGMPKHVVLGTPATHHVTTV